METVTLRGQDFKIIHNTLCDLRNLVGRMEQSMIKTQEFDRIIEGFQMGLKDAYAQDNSAFDRKNDQYRHWQQHYGLKSIWSIYEVDNMTLCHPYKDAEYVIYDNHWGESGEVVRKIEGRDWNALYRAADAAIQASGDSHHVFIEHFEPVADKPHHLRLSTGS